MKTNKQRLLNIVVATSIFGNLVLVGGLGYIASVDNHIHNLNTAMNSPVVVYIPKAVRDSGLVTSSKAAPGAK